MKPYYQDKAIIYLGDCREILSSLADFSAVVTDPPYELGFMGKSWDSQGVSFQKETWEIIRKSCLSGSPLLSFGGSRTQHRIACAIEDAGWEIRDTLMYVYGSGFPKSLDVAWKMHEVACNVCGFMVEYDHDNQQAEGGVSQAEYPMRFVRATYLQTPVYACAKCGQVLQPFLPKQDTQKHREAWRKSEVIWGEQSSVERWDNLEATKGELRWCEVCKMSHKILADGSEGWLHSRASASNGSIPWQISNEDGSRPSYRPQSIKQLENQLDALLYERRAQKTRGWGSGLKPAYEPIILAQNPLDGTFANNALKHKVAGLNIDQCRIPMVQEDIETNTAKASREFVGVKPFGGNDGKGSALMPNQKGRFPANFLHDGSQMVMELFPNSSITGHRRDFNRSSKAPVWISNPEQWQRNSEYTDNGSAARFFYCAKASKAERNAGCEGMPLGEPPASARSKPAEGRRNALGEPRPNNHPTVKPLALMEYLCKLVKMPEYNLILDPFCGSGTTLLACTKLGIPCIGIDSDEQSCEIAARRCSQEVMDFNEVPKKDTFCEKL